MEQQTAVEWLIMQLPVKIRVELYEKNIHEQAKQMEKEQIAKSWHDGNFLGRNGWILADYSTGDRYYKKNYGN